MSLFGDVIITTYVNPNLFWLVQNSKDRTEDLKHIDALIRKYIQLKHIKVTCEVGEFVIVEVENKYYRAVIEGCNGIKIGQKRPPKSYFCWLMDYGQICEAENIYKSDQIVQKMPPLSVQASLNNVCYVKQQLHYGQEEVMIYNENVTTPSPICRQVSKLLLSNCHSMQFKFESKSNGISFGDILYQGKYTVSRKSLRDGLIGKNILCPNTELFEEIKVSINAYKKKHLRMISDMCKKSLGVIEEGITNRSGTRPKFILKYLNELKVIDITGHRNSLPLSNIYGSRNITSSTSHTSGVSESEPSEKPLFTREMALLEMIRNERNSMEAKNPKLNNIRECNNEQEPCSGCSFTEFPPKKRDSAIHRMSDDLTNKSGTFTDGIKTHDNPKLCNVKKFNNKQGADSESSSSEFSAEKRYLSNPGVFNGNPFRVTDGITTHKNPELSNNAQGAYSGFRHMRYSGEKRYGPGRVTIQKAHFVPAGAESSFNDLHEAAIKATKNDVVKPSKWN